MYTGRAMVLLSLLCGLFASSAAQPGSSRTVSLAPRAAAFPCCGYGARITPSPPCPTEHDALRVICSARWPDSCTPEYYGDHVGDRTIQVFALGTYPEGTACLTVITPFEIVADIGKLAPGTYTVEFYIANRPWCPEFALCAADSVVIAAAAPASHVCLPVVFSRCQP
jgi:hypothetical protein